MSGFRFGGHLLTSVNGHDQEANCYIVELDIKIGILYLLLSLHVPHLLNLSGCTLSFLEVLVTIVYVCMVCPQVMVAFCSFLYVVLLCR